MSFIDFNKAKSQSNFEVIPHNTIAPARLWIKQGFHACEQDPDGYATKSKSSNAVYLACEYIVLGGKFDNRKIFSNIGLYSEKSSLYEEMGASTIKAILDSAYGLMPNDMSSFATKKRQIESYRELNNLKVLVQVIIKEYNGESKNDIGKIITPKDSVYNNYMETKVSHDDLDDEIPF